MKNEVVKVNVPNVGEVCVKATMRGLSNGTKMFNSKHYQYNLVIWSKNGRMRVTFHDSYYNYSNGIKKLEGEALLDAFDCVLMDITAYLNDEIRDCYDSEHKKEMALAEKGCKMEAEKFAVVVGGEDNIRPSIDYLTEYIHSRE